MSAFVYKTVEYLVNYHWTKHDTTPILLLNVLRLLINPQDIYRNLIISEISVYTPYLLVPVFSLCITSANLFVFDCNYI